MIIKPQPGFQTSYLSNPADILIGGGSAGGGKTFALLLDLLRYIKNPDFGAVIFRRITPQVTNEGGLWDTSEKLYPLLGAKPREFTLEWNFRQKSRVKFAHLEYEKNKYNWQGAQVPFIGFDELTQFTETQFFYLLSRNRSVSGVRPCVRCSCNPDPDSWVAEFLEWWIDQDTGYSIPERDGVIRYFARLEGNLIWGDSKKEILKKYPETFKNFAEKSKELKPEDFIKSVSFVRGDVFGNAELLRRDPGYLSGLMALDEAEQMKLLRGNWKVRTDGMSLFDFDKIQDLFSNFSKEEKPRSYITCDAARFGRDLMVILLWEGFRISTIRVLTKNDTEEGVEAIEEVRKIGGVGKSDVLVDQGGVGGGIVDIGRYKGFTSAASSLPDPATKIKENYEMLKAQCAYRMADRVNVGEISISMKDVKIDDRRTDRVKLGAKLWTVQNLIREDLRSFKKFKPDGDKTKKIEPKELQKAALGGRSPDFGDAFIMREWFELRPRTRVLL